MAEDTAATASRTLRIAGQGMETRGTKPRVFCFHEGKCEVTGI